MIEELHLQNDSYQAELLPASAALSLVNPTRKMGSVSQDTLHHKLPRILQFLARVSSLEVRRGTRAA